MRAKVPGQFPDEERWRVGPELGREARQEAAHFIDWLSPAAREYLDRAIKESVEKDWYGISSRDLMAPAILLGLLPADLANRVWATVGGVWENAIEKLETHHSATYALQLLELVLATRPQLVAKTFRLEPAVKTQLLELPGYSAYAIPRPDADDERLLANLALIEAPDSLPPPIRQHCSRQYHRSEALRTWESGHLMLFLRHAATELVFHGTAPELSKEDWRRITEFIGVDESHILELFARNQSDRVDTSVAAMTLCSIRDVAVLASGGYRRHPDGQIFVETSLNFDAPPVAAPARNLVRPSLSYDPRS